jgi:hypothetical protein
VSDLTDANARLNAAFARIVDSDPTLREFFANMGPSKLRFPNGLRYRYFHAAQAPKFRQWWCCWSTTKNANGKFVSWVYEWRGREGNITRECEHRRRSAAKARALRLRVARDEVVRAAHPVVQP